MKNVRTTALLGLLLLASCRTATVGSDTETLPEVASPPAADATQLPTGTPLTVSLNEGLAPGETQEGDTFTATLTKAIVDQRGEVLVPEGATVEGVVTGVQPSGRVGEQAAIKLDPQRLSFSGREIPIDAAITETEIETEGVDKVRVGTGAGIGAAAGAVLGAVIGDGLKGAVIGGLLGAGAGTVISLGTGEREPKLPEGTELKLRLTEPVQLKPA